MTGFKAVSLAALTAATLFLKSTLADVDPIVIKGSKFFYKTNGTQFYIRGVAYQQDYNGNGTTSDSSNSAYVDPLADESACKRDIPYLLELRTNVIRTYAVDPTQNHDGCMNALADAGIYVISDLSAPVSGQSINRNDPSWDASLYTRYTAVVDALQGYTNVLGFFAGNEVSNAPNNTDASAFVRAAVRDTKAYIKAKGYRTIGVGYAANDDAAIVQPLADYFDCDDSASAIDFFGYNIYSWCGDATYQSSSYAEHTKEFSTYNVPAFFAEYGCNEVEPREFTEVAALFGDQMAPVWSGGIVYMYFQESNNYGLVTVSGSSVQTNDDFSNLKTKMASVSPTGTAMSAYSATNSAASCPTSESNWTAVASPLPPSPNAALCSCMMSSLECVVKDSTDSTSYGELFGTVCGLGDTVCDGIAANGSTGTYGAYGMCSPKQQLAFAFNQYYDSQSKTSSACDFSGAATLQSSAKATGSCSSLLNQAGTQGTGSVTASPTAGGTAASAASSSGGAGVGPRPGVQGGLLPAGIVAMLGLVSGVGMLVL